MAKLAFKDIADDVYPATQHTRKPPAYEAVYEETLGHLREVPIRMLELGVHSGHSLLLWHAFLTKADITGVDMRPAPDNLPADRVRFVQGRQEDEAVIEKAADGGMFDVIVDDASHIGRFTKRSFQLLFDWHLKPGGLYIVEDIAASVHLPTWPDHAPLQAPQDEGDRFFSYDTGIIGFLKQVTDIAACHGRSVQSVCFRQSIAIIRKSPDAGLKGISDLL